MICINFDLGVNSVPDKIEDKFPKTKKREKFMTNFKFFLDLLFKKIISIKIYFQLILSYRINEKINVKSKFVVITHFCYSFIYFIFVIF